MLFSRRTSLASNAARRGRRLRSRALLAGFVAALLSSCLFPDVSDLGSCADGSCSGTGGMDASSGGSAGSDAGGSGGVDAATGGASGNGAVGATGGSSGSGGVGGDAGADAGSPCGTFLGGPMVPIEKYGYCIDATEVTKGEYTKFLEDAGATASDASPECAWNTSHKPPDYLYETTSTTDDDPVQGINWCNARAYCAWAGKRLCGKIGGGSLAMNETGTAASEWHIACSRDGARTYPYPGQHNPQNCNDGKGGVTPFGQEPVGSNPACQGGYDGIYDMSGNLFEWVDACGSEAPDTGDTDCQTLGGSWNFDGNATFCSFGQSHPRGSAGPQWGFRCCKDL